MAIDALRFTYRPDPADGGEGWGWGALQLGGAPYWFGPPEEYDGQIKWTWVDLLEYLAEHWAALTLEQHYPLAWLAREITHPGQVWECADRRWALMGEDEALVAEEEATVLAFMTRHNLAQAWKGLSLPQLLWLRVGHNVWLVPETGHPILARFEPLIAHLEAVANAIAEPLRGSTHPRVQRAVDRWERRRQSLAQGFIEWTTGWSPADWAIIQSGQAANDFWSPVEPAQSPYRENEILAAARMMRYSLGAADVRVVLDLIKQLPRQATPELDRVSADCELLLREANAPHPWEQGYWLANWMRARLGLATAERCNPEMLLAQWHVHIGAGDLRSDHLDAVACWGQVGPAIVLNGRPGAKVSATPRRRITLAHELGHLLVDRQGAFPVAEVLGGSADPFAEQRARAFAAELLLPRQAARQVYRDSENLTKTLNRLQRHFGVSKQVAAYQLKNSYCTLQGDDEAELHDYVASIGMAPPILVRY